jgi:hypothetical protein
MATVRSAELLLPRRWCHEAASPQVVGGRRFELGLTQLSDAAETNAQCSPLGAGCRSRRVACAHAPFDTLWRFQPEAGCKYLGQAAAPRGVDQTWRAARLSCVPTGRHGLTQ